MATTVVSLSQTAWTLVSTGNVAGFLTSNTNNHVIITEQASLPSESLTTGHIVPDIGYNFSLDGTENLYARVAKGSGSVSVTEV